MKILTLLALLAVSSVSSEAYAAKCNKKHCSTTSVHSTHKSNKSKKSAPASKRAGTNRFREELLAPLGRFASSTFSRKITKSEEDCLVRTMNSEARDTERGLQSVANVVYNRYRQSHKHICSITRAPAQFTEKAVREKGRKPRLLHIAKSVTTNELPDITRGATNFFTSSAKGLIKRFKRDGYVVTTEIDGNTFMKKI